MAGFRTSPVWARVIFAVPCSIMTCTPEMAATSLASSWVPPSPGGRPPSGVPPTTILRPHPINPVKLGLISSVCVAFSLDGSWQIWSVVLFGARRKQKLVSAGSWRQVAGRLEMGFRGSRLDLEGVGKLLFGFIISLEWKPLFLFLRTNNLILRPVVSVTWACQARNHLHKAMSVMVSRHMKRCSASLIMRDMQLRTTVGYHLTLAREAIVRQSTNNKCWRWCGKKGTLLHWCWECQLVLPLWRTVWRFLKILQIELLYDPATPFLDIYPKRDTCTPCWAQHYLQ